MMMVHLSLVVFCQHCKAVSANLVSSVTVVRHPAINITLVMTETYHKLPITSSNNTRNCSRSKKSTSHAVCQQGARDPYDEEDDPTVCKGFLV